MNDPIKYMILGAGIAIASATVTGLIMAWGVRQATASTPGRAVVQRAAGQPAFASTSSPRSTGLAAAASPASQKPPTASVIPSLAGGQAKVEDQPAVRQAREAYLAAQKKYAAALQEAMQTKPDPDGNKAVAPTPKKR